MLKKTGDTSSQMALSMASFSQIPPHPNSNKTVNSEKQKMIQRSSYNNNMISAFGSEPISSQLQIKKTDNYFPNLEQMQLNG